MLSCVGSEMVSEIWKYHEEYNFQANLSAKLRDEVHSYVCSDKKLKSATPTDEQKWVKENYETSTVLTLHETQNSLIHLVKDFISNEECASILQNDSTTQFSILGPRGVTNEEIVDTISRRMYDYANFYSDFEVEQAGQEDIFVFRKSGKEPTESAQ